MYVGTPGDQRARILLATVLCVLSLAAGLSALRASETEGPVEILITRDLRGYLEPCDCEAEVLGGFPRRATAIARSNPDLLLDADGLVFQASLCVLQKLRLMLELDGKLGYAAVNVGQREAEFSKFVTLRLAADSPVPLISANLADREGRRALPGHLVVERERIRFGVVGAVTSRENPGDSLHVLPGCHLPVEMNGTSSRNLSTVRPTAKPSRRYHVLDQGANGHPDLRTVRTKSDPIIVPAAEDANALRRAQGRCSSQTRRAPQNSPMTTDGGRAAGITLGQRTHRVWRRPPSASRPGCRTLPP